MFILFGFFCPFKRYDIVFLLFVGSNNEHNCSKFFLLHDVINIEQTLTLGSNIATLTPWINLFWKIFLNFILYHYSRKTWTDGLDGGGTNKYFELG